MISQFACRVKTAADTPVADGGDAASPPVLGNIATPVRILIVEYRACAEVDYTFLRDCFLRHESSPNM